MRASRNCFPPRRAIAILHRRPRAGLRIPIAVADRFPIIGLFDVAVCCGATFIWDGFAASIQAMREAIKTGGRLTIGEVHWHTDQVPADFRLQQKEVNREIDLLAMAHQEGFDFEYMLRASHDDWDRYEASNWDGLLRWIEENPAHFERQQVIDHLHESQDEYFTYGRKYFGWALYLLNPVKNR